jgi:hypothetical protein
MNVTRMSMLDGTINSMEIDVTQAQLDAYELSDLLLQDAFPDLPAEEREFIKTGITPESWEYVLWTPEQVDALFD